MNEESVQLLTEVLPHIATQLRLSLNTMRSALQRAEDKRTPESAILRQSYYRLLRMVTNLTNASLLYDHTPVEKQDTELVSWFDTLCRQAEVPLEQNNLTLQMHTQLRSQITAIHRDYTQRIFWNLLSNAAKFTAPGGRIDVTLSRQGDQILLQVADTGCGISLEEQKTLFERFLHTSQMDPPPQGLGLGLPLCRAMAQKQGGRLLLQSVEGQGTCVTLALPAARSEHICLQDQPFHYAGGFQPVMMELSDALPYQSFSEENLDI